MRVRRPSAFSASSPDGCGTAAEIADLGRIVAFRNVLIHGYASIDDRLVWEIATERTARLVETLTRLLEKL